jgi:hypothetical protein
MRAEPRRPLVPSGRTPLEQLAATTGRFRTDPPDLRYVCFHVLQEYARHAGHLDVAVELAGGPVGSSQALHQRERARPAHPHEHLGGNPLRRNPMWPVPRQAPLVASPDTHQRRSFRHWERADSRSPQRCAIRHFPRPAARRRLTS